MIKKVISAVLMMAAVAMIAGCSGTGQKELTLASVPAASTTPPGNLKQAETEKRNAVLREHLARWEQNTNRNDLASAISAIQIAQATGSCPWGARGSDILTGILARKSDNAVARAWNGVAVIPCIVKEGEPLIRPLDFVPLPPVLEIGSIAYDITSGDSTKEIVVAMYADLDGAVERTPDHPTVRLLRGYTYAVVENDTGIYTLSDNSIFSGTDTPEKDFALLDGWVKNPAGNPEYAELLTDRSWLKLYYLLRARALVNRGVFSDSETPESRAAWQGLLEVSDDEADRNLAGWRLKE